MKDKSRGWFPALLYVLMLLSVIIININCVSFPGSAAGRPPAPLNAVVSLLFPLLTLLLLLVARLHDVRPLLLVTAIIWGISALVSLLLISGISPPVFLLPLTAVMNGLLWFGRLSLSFLNNLQLALSVLFVFLSLFFLLFRKAKS